MVPVVWLLGAGPARVCVGGWVRREGRVCTPGISLLRFVASRVFLALTSATQRVLFSSTGLSVPTANQIEVVKQARCSRGELEMHRFKTRASFVSDSDNWTSRVSRSSVLLHYRKLTYLLVYSYNIFWFLTSLNASSGCQSQ